MGCTARLCTSEKIFLFINIAFAMYSGALLATAARLAWDPSTYTWLRFLCAAQYRASAAYAAACGLWLAALVYLAAAATQRPASTCLHLYCAGVCWLALSEVCFGAWLGASLAAWWRAAPEAELARRGLDLLRDLKPALLAMHHYRDLVRPIYDIIEEIEHEAPNNVFVIIVFGVFGMILQVAAFVMARRLARRAPEQCALPEKASPGGGSASGDEDSDGAEPPAPVCRKNANLRMYTILDKIF